jgi:hypothetical protein
VTSDGLAAVPSDVDDVRHQSTSHRERHAMTSNLASGALVVLGIVFAVLGLFNGEILLTVIGLAAIVAGGLLGLAARRTA